MKIIIIIFLLIGLILINGCDKSDESPLDTSQITGVRTFVNGKLGIVAEYDGCDLSEGLYFNMTTLDFVDADGNVICEGKNKLWNGIGD